MANPRVRNGSTITPTSNKNKSNGTSGLSRVKHLLKKKIPERFTMREYDSGEMTSKTDVLILNGFIGEERAATERIADKSIVEEKKQGINLSSA